MLTFLLIKMESGEIKGFIILGIRFRNTRNIDDAQFYHWNFGFKFLDFSKHCASV